MFGKYCILCILHSGIEHFPTYLILDARWGHFNQVKILANKIVDRLAFFLLEISYLD